jgi:hypothetical protein
MAVTYHSTQLLVEMRSWEPFYRLALNPHLSDLILPSSWEYWCETWMPSPSPFFET